MAIVFFMCWVLGVGCWVLGVGCWVFRVLTEEWGDCFGQRGGIVNALLNSNQRENYPLLCFNLLPVFNLTIVMKKLAIFALSLLPFLSYAQEQDSVNAVRTGSYVSVAVINPNLSDLNQRLRAAGLAPLTEGFVGTSFGITNRFADQNSYSVTRLSFLASTDDRANENLSTRLIVWELSIMGHYDLLSNPNWLIYPYLGFGTNYARLTVSSIGDNSNFQSSLNNIASEEVFQKKYGSDGLMVFGELGGGIERILKFNGFYMFVGASGGYRLASSRAWTYKGVKPFGDTSFGTQGWTFDFKFRFEINPNPDQKVSRGLYQFFQ